MGLALDLYNDMARLYINTLKDEGKIDDRVFAFLIGLDHNMPSKFMIGGYDL